MKMVLTVWDDGLWIAQVDPEVSPETIAKGTHAWSRALRDGGQRPLVYCDSGCDERHRLMCEAVNAMLRATKLEVSR